MKKKLKKFIERYLQNPKKYSKNDKDDFVDMAYIYRSEFDYISRCILDYPNIETGGQLFGFFTEEGVPVVCYAIGPGLQANHQVAFFNQDIAYLQKVYNEINSLYGLRYIGEWHSHHKLGLAQPSGHDESTVIHGMKKAKFKHFMLCIGNLNEKNQTTLNSFSFNLNNRPTYICVPWNIKESESPYRSIIDKRLSNILCHPQTKLAVHGNNYIKSTQVPTLRIPNYNKEYWLNEKSNNHVLKCIIEFLSKNGAVVIPKMDEQNYVCLFVQYENMLEIVKFEDQFPYEAPAIITQNKSYVAEWVYNGDIFDSFVLYYTKFKKNNL